MAATSIKGGPSGTSNVVRLPTAAPRKVDNVRFVAQRYAARKLREGSPWSTSPVSPATREADAKARRISELAATPELIILRAILSTMDGAQHAAIGAQIAADIWHHPTREKLTALDMVQLCRPMTFGEAQALHRAFDRIEQEER